MKGKLPDDLGVRDPGLRLLLRSLAGAPTPDELAGEPAALLMFRTAHRPLASASAGDAVDASVSRRSRGAPTRRPARRAAWLAAATTVALFGGLTAAGYVAVLPAPVQQFAHRLLGFVGVPDPGRSGQPGTPTGRAGPSSRQRVSPRSGSLAQGLPMSAPGPSAAAPVSVSLRTDGHRARAVLIVSCPLAKRGDVVQLQRWSAGGWNTLRERRAGQVRHVKFTVPIGEASVKYRIVLLVTADHARSISRIVTVVGRPHPGRPHRG